MVRGEADRPKRVRPRVDDEVGVETVAHVGARSVFSNWPTSKTPLGYVQGAAFSPHSAYAAIANDKGKVLLYRLNHYEAA